MTDRHTRNDQETVKFLFLEGASSLTELLHLIINFYAASRNFKSLYKRHHRTQGIYAISHLGFGGVSEEERQCPDLVNM